MCLQVFCVIIKCTDPPQAYIRSERNPTQKVCSFISVKRISTNVYEDRAKSIMAERATTEVFSLILMVIFVGVLILNAVSC